MGIEHCRLAGTSPIAYDEHGAYRTLFVFLNDATGHADAMTLRWNGKRWAKGRAHVDVAAWVGKVQQTIDAAAHAGFIDRGAVVSLDENGRVTMSATAIRVVEKIHVTVKQEA